MLTNLYTVPLRHIMNILLLGSGGREHAFAHKLAASKKCTQLFIAPGNTGTAQFGKNVTIGILDFEAQKTFCIENKIEMVVVGPEDPLVAGIYDFYATDATLQHIIVVGPSAAGAQLEGSKDFAKAFMAKHKIPTASYATFTNENYDAGITYLKAHTLPIVLKADGLAAGKGVIIAQTHEEALQTYADMLQGNKFGNAGAKVVIEQFLDGLEMSVFVLTDAKDYVLLPNAKDYKRIGKGDTGLNTGGMGAISPVPFADATFMQKVITQVVQPTVDGLATDKMVYNGFVFIGLIKVADEPYVIEYNCRMGDPETEAVLPRLENDLVELFIAMRQNKLNEIEIKHSTKHAATVVLVSGGYPENFDKGFEIKNLETVQESFVYHAGTKLVDDKIVTNGGRVLAITSLADSVQEALMLSKKNADVVDYEGKYYREDIGWEFVAS
jgi:phosphoribosylamine---glycine ligase